ncbi:MAG: cobalamin B12-binding domain-containing protein [Gemmatimonadota bacterium]
MAGRGSHGSGRRRARREGIVVVEGSAGEVEHLVGLLRGPEEEAAGAYVGSLVRCGRPVGALYLGLLTQAARHFGELWERDECDFFEVTLAVGRIQRLVGRLRTEFAAAGRDGDAVGRILLVCVPGEQHTLGLSILAEYFVRAGWSVELGGSFGLAPGLNRLGRSWYDVLGFSVSRSDSLCRVTRAIARARKESLNPALRVLVGGQVVLDRPALVEEMGADGTGADAELALASAHA